MSAANRTAVLEDALAAVNGERNQSYSEPEDNFGRTAQLWSAYLTVDITAVDVAVLMVLLKVARLMHTPGHVDSWVDIAGYAACGADVAASS
jgi:hypothetical protein